jgi:RNA-binding motif X-linked protein 2
MNVIKEIERINEYELKNGISGSWHDAYKDCAYINIGGLDESLKEDDLVKIFSQFGEIEDVNLVRDKNTGKSRGFAFIKYADQRSTVLAIDNFNGIKLMGKSIRVDHVREYRKLPQERKV